MALRLVCAVLLTSSAVASLTTVSSNPIRRVVNMLQMMQKKVQEEGKRDEELFEKYMCYCTSGQGNLQQSIQAAESKMPQVTSALSESTAKKDQLEADLKTHYTDRADAKATLAKASSIREKEAAAHAKEISEAGANLKALDKAIAAIAKGMGTDFLQTTAAALVRKVAIDMDLSNADRDTLSAFLSEAQSDSNAYAPASGEVQGILKQMRDTMAATRADLQKDEEAAKAAFEALSAAKSKEIHVQTRMIEEKTERVGQIGVDIVNLKEDLDDTSASYVEDKDFLLNMDENCKTRQTEWEAVKKSRADETVALADTIKILNDDDALDLFKATLPSPSLLQMKVQAKEVRSRAVNALSMHADGRRVADPRLDFLILAMRGKKVSFEKVLGMIDEMTKVLKREQTDDESKKEYCEKQMDFTEDAQKALERDIADLGKTIEEAKSAVETLGEDIAALTTSITALDASVVEATEMRKEEHAEYQKTIAADTATVKLLSLAKDRLNQFYNPALSQRRKEDSPALVQIQAHSDRSSEGEAPPPPPEAVTAYQKKSEASAGALSMLELLSADLSKEMVAMKTEEKDSQADYEKYVQESANKRRVDSKSLQAKEGAKAEAGALLQKASQEEKSKEKEAYATSMVLRDLHHECDWLVSNYGVRAEARAGELESLSKAKAILSGADYSLVQVGHQHRLLRGERH